MLNTQLNLALEQLKSQVEQFLLLLSEKERFVIERRFNLDDKERSTLEEIGQHFHITRERVRQIERNALQKLRRNVENTLLQPINDLVYQYLQEAGGLLREDILLSKILQDPTGFPVSAITLVISLDKRFDRFPNSIHYHPYVKFKSLSEDFIHFVVQKSLIFLQQKKDVLSLESLYEELSKLPEVLNQPSFVPASLSSLFHIHKSFKIVDGKVGLLTWRHIHPRTLRDKIFYILRKAKKPLHFVDISNDIIASQFDRKNVNVQAVHNELIRSEQFILIGRGIYALKEWGYKSGTVADVIESVLRKKQVLDQEKIIEEVAKQRQVKPITVVLNLKNNPHFVRVGRKQYALRDGVS